MGNAIIRYYTQPEPSPDYLIRDGCRGFTIQETEVLNKAPFWMPSGQFGGLSEAITWMEKTRKGEGPFYAFIANTGSGMESPAPKIQVYFTCPDIMRDGRPAPNYDALSRNHRWLSNLLDSAQYNMNGNESCNRPASGTNRIDRNYSVRRDLFFQDDYSDRYFTMPAGCVGGGCPLVNHPFNTKNFGNYPKKNQYYYLYRINRGIYSAPLKNMLTNDVPILPEGPWLTSQNGAYRFAIYGSEIGVYNSGFRINIQGAISRVSLEDNELVIYVKTGEDSESVSRKIKLSDGSKDSPYSLVLWNDGRLVCYDRFNQIVTSKELTDINNKIAPNAPSLLEGDTAFLPYDENTEYERRLKNLLAYLEIRGLLKYYDSGKVLKTSSNDINNDIRDVAFKPYDPALDYQMRLDKLRVIFNS